MSRLGPWQPSTIEERLDRMESLAEIRQLPMRYALCLDSRDMDALVELFEPEVRVGREQVGRPALREWFVATMAQMHTSIHLVANHIIDFDDADHARGIVYCRDELERPQTGDWDVGALQYWDSYVRLEGSWYFRRRRFHRWYIADALTRPATGLGTDSGTNSLTTHQLPHAFASWSAFWAEAGQAGLVRWDTGTN